MYKLLFTLLCLVTPLLHGAEERPVKRVHFAPEATEERAMAGAGAAAPTPPEISDIDKKRQKLFYLLP